VNQSGLEKALKEKKHDNAILWPALHLMCEFFERDL
jgi:hypothetical protein